VFTVGYSGFLFGPPIIGSVADQIGLTSALTGLAIVAGLATLFVPLALRATATPQPTPVQPSEAATPSML
jgi:hypothetical protein